MTGWYDPGVMARSAIMLATANIFGRHSDTRLIEALGNQPQTSFDYSEHAGEFSFDYVADLGDGWDATFAVANAIAEPQLELQTPDGTTVRTAAGKLLVFGGDLVYPYPSRERYVLHTEGPYAQALDKRDPRPDIFAIPGNHDWFDSLVAFSRSLCRPERGFAGCQTRQTRSYFAVHLPQGWWLLGVDLQLGAELDEPQVRYFQAVAREMQTGDRVILCVPEPQWIYETIYPEHAAYRTGNIEQLEQDILGTSASLYVTGDLHYYRRHANAAGVQKVIAGGGGAFLHPTHQPDVRELRDGFIEQTCYPDVRTSRRLGWLNLLFPFINPRAAWVTAVVYTLTAWLASARLDSADLESPGQALGSALRVALREPVYGMWLIAFVAGLLFFTDTHSRVYRVIGGGLHAIAHLLAAFLLAWLALRLTVDGFGLPFGSALQLLAAGFAVFVGAALVGPLLIGIYLFVSLQVFGRHSNEAFSALRIADYKHWLRFVIDAAGNLTVYAIGIDRVGRRGRAGSKPRLVDVFTLRKTRQ
jgi:hypothetical protein